MMMMRMIIIIITTLADKETMYMHYMSFSDKNLFAGLNNE